MHHGAEDRLIVALDGPARHVRALVEALPEVSVFKVGMEAFYREGAPLVNWIRGHGHDVFLDLKLHDIPNTVERAAHVVASLGVRFLTVHASGGPEMLARAARAATEASPDAKVLAVTLLTSLTGDELPGFLDAGSSAEEKVATLARLAMSAGCHGVVASPREARVLRETIGDDGVIVCPGIRPRGSDSTDQRRVASPAEAIAAGADHIVVGRPITAAPDPAGAAAAVLAEIRASGAAEPFGNRVGL